jgi:hypothetical protein
VFHLQRYLAVVGGLTTEADFVFVPEDPPPTDWQIKLCQKLEQARKSFLSRFWRPSILLLFKKSIRIL